MTFIQLAK